MVRPEPWTTLSSDIVYDCPGFEVVSETVSIPGGPTTDFDFVREGESVVIVPLTPDGQVVTIEEYREAVGRVSWGVPAGGVEPDDDSVAAAARRELTEETGYEADAVEVLGAFEAANGFTDATHAYVLAEGCEPTAGPDREADESITVDTTPFDELVAATASGELRDGRSALGVLYVATHRPGVFED
ncbi:NUDIX hydrolase [Halococcoides cellulosivorans]|uniref:NUDIX hydrolase n=1 Tax=Halococcoides cellulosivorans TaxID=1679096 RepID=A0A2R4WZS7_9EURY|nr:NUDIX hydrolase [Halococcoides cellulosivorans]AWB27052.1 NUDIX hydrolase [Halococcoides cellulosivorans]